MHVQPDANGKLALVQMPRHAGEWFLRKGAGTVWSAESEPGPGGLVTASLRLLLDVTSSKWSPVTSRAIARFRSEGRFAVPVISYNANLSADQRARSIGRQWLRAPSGRGPHVAEHRSLHQQSDDLTVDLCRVNAMAGDLDTPRSALREILQRSPDHFEALTVLGFIEANCRTILLPPSITRSSGGSQFTRNRSGPRRGLEVEQ